MAAAAPSRMPEISTPATARGSSPAGVRTEYRPPMSRGMEKVAYPSWLARARRVPSVRSVVTKMRSRAPSRPYFSSSSCRKRKKAMADSVVEPDRCV